MTLRFSQDYLLLQEIRDVFDGLLEVSVAPPCDECSEFCAQNDHLTDNRHELRRLREAVADRMYAIIRKEV